MVAISGVWWPDMKGRLDFMKSENRLRPAVLRRGRARLWALALVGIVWLLAVLATASPAAAVPPVSSVSDKIMCLCGCGSVLSVCPHPDCSWGIPAKEDIKQQLAAGKTPDAIIAQYVSKYGEQVLAAPTKRGFNMVVWVTPFAMLVIGAGVIYYLARTWAARRAETDEGTIVTPVPVEDHPDEMVRRMEDELKKFD
jgi:cytochrome c-type biogenesis protein CcmH